MARYKIILAYDGTDFQGFQRQLKARTVQESVESALRSIGWQGTAIQAAGRTDTGVHASGQVIALKFDWNHSPKDMMHALNANLPADIAAKSVEPVMDDFHPRFSATARRYQYRLLCDETRQPLRERYAWRVWPAISLGILQEAADHLVGTYDFSSFGSPPQPGGSTIRQVFSTAWLQDGSDLVFEILGNSFLYHMVRRLVFFQVELGQGRGSLGEIDTYLDGKHKVPIIGLAPAQGLSLVEVMYSKITGGS
jgi:tRNA pseudouridine38-40 synthase